MFIASDQLRPDQPLPVVAAGTQDVDVGDILLIFYPRIVETTVTPEAPLRSGSAELAVVTTHPLGTPLTVRWEKQIDRRSWEEVGTGTVIQWTVPPERKSHLLRVIVSDGFTDKTKSFTVVPRNLPPQILSLEADLGTVVAGQDVNLIAMASDPEGDPLAFKWSVSPGSWWPAPTGNTATWTAPQTLRVLTRSILVRVTDGQASVTRSRTIRVTPKPPPVISAFNALIGDGVAPVDVNLTAQIEGEDDGPLRYNWSIYKQTEAGGYFEPSVLDSTTGPSYTHRFDGIGVYKAFLTVINDVGLQAESEEVVFRLLSRPTVDLAATPRDGQAPIEVTFSAAAMDQDGQVVEYQWDFDGDGTIDQTSTTGIATHVYSNEGTFQAQVTVVDNDGLTASATVTVTTLAPEGVPIILAFNVLTGDGVAPLDVGLTAQVEDAVGGGLRYEWSIYSEIEASGNFEPSVLDSTSEPSYTLRLDSIGVYKAFLTVIDDRGLQAESEEVVFRLLARPSVDLAATPTDGQAPIDVSFTAVAMDEDGQVTEYQWDFDGDGTIDQSTTTPTVTNTYTDGGTFQAQVTVVDDDGLTASDTVTVTTLAPELLTVSMAANATQGNAPFSVTFTVSTTGPVATIIDYQWDFDGDGAPDQVTVSGTSTHVYTTLGLYQAAVKVNYAGGTIDEGPVAIRVLPAGFVNHPILGAPELIALDSPLYLSQGNLAGSGFFDLVIGSQNRVDVLRRDLIYEVSQTFTFFDADILDLATGQFSAAGRVDVVLAVQERDSPLPGGPPEDSDDDEVETTADTVVLLPSQADGTFGVPMDVELPIGIQPRLLAPGNFNGDANLDLVLATADGVKLILGNGDGTFNAVAPITVMSAGSVVNPHPSTGDVNEDGFLDVVVTGLSAPGGSTVGFVVAGNGDGTFQAPASISELDGTDFTGASATENSLADLNGDGASAWWWRRRSMARDLVVTGLGGEGKVLVLLGNGSGTFSGPTTYTPGVSVSQLFAEATAA